MGFVDRLERWSNAVADRDWLWWPLVTLRPQRAQRFSVALALGLALVTVLAALGAVSLYRHWSQWPNPLDVLAVVGGVAFAIVGALFLAFAYFWNRRARRLGPLP